MGFSSKTGNFACFRNQIPPVPGLPFYSNPLKSSEYPIPKDENIGKIGIGIPLIFMMVDAMMVGHDQYQSECVI